MSLLREKKSDKHGLIDGSRQPQHRSLPIVELDYVPNEASTEAGSDFSPFRHLSVFSSIATSTRSVGEIGTRRRRNLIVRSTSPTTRACGMRSRIHDLRTAAKTRQLPNCLRHRNVSIPLQNDGSRLNLRVCCTKDVSDDQSLVSVLDAVESNGTLHS